MVRLLTGLRLAITLDETFREFYYWCKANDVPVIVVSR